MVELSCDASFSKALCRIQRLEKIGCSKLLDEIKQLQLQKLRLLSVKYYASLERSNQEFPDNEIDFNEHSLLLSETLTVQRSLHDTLQNNWNIMQINNAVHACMGEVDDWNKTAYNHSNDFTGILKSIVELRSVNLELAAKLARNIEHYDKLEGSLLEKRLEYSSLLERIANQRSQLEDGINPDDQSGVEESQEITALRKIIQTLEDKIHVASSVIQGFITSSPLWGTNRKFIQHLMLCERIRTDLAILTGEEVSAIIRKAEPGTGPNAPKLPADAVKEKTKAKHQKFTSSTPFSKNVK